MRGIEIHGVIALDDETDHDTFMDLFLEWLDEQGFEFEGTSKPADVSDEE